MKLVTIDCVPGGRPGAMLGNGEILHLERAALPGTAETWLPPTMRGILAAGEEGLDLVRRIVARVEGHASDGRADARRPHRTTITSCSLTWWPSRPYAVS